MPLDASVIVRAKDKADTIEATLRSVRAQSQACELIVVDSGSSDATVSIARKYADQVIEIPASEFTYGGALNLGAENASGDVHFALSAHCVPMRDDWIARSVSLYDNERVAGTNQAQLTPTGDLIADCYLQTLEDALAHPVWGFSNHASSWRATVWRELPFRTDLSACEDKDWSWRVLQAGYTIAYCPELAVPAAHRRKEGVARLRRRVANEAFAMVSLGASRPLSPREAIRLGLTYFPLESRKPKAVRVFSPHRAAELAGAVAGGRRALRRGITPAAIFADMPAEQRPLYDPLR